MTLSKKQRRRVGRYCREVANQLNLRDWTLEVMHDPCDDDSLASVNLTSNRRIAQISFCSRFADLSPEQQRETVVHELLHCHINDTTDYVHELKTLIGEPAWKLWRAAHVETIELATDAIAGAVAPFMALPEL